MNQTTSRQDIKLTIAIQIRRDKILAADSSVVDRVSCNGRRMALRSRVVDEDSGGLRTFQRVFVCVAPAYDPLFITVDVKIGAPGGVSPLHGLVDHVSIPEALSGFRFCAQGIRWSAFVLVSLFAQETKNKG